MAQSPPFVLPPGVALRLTEQGLHLSYDGDIDLQESPETGFALVEAGGDLEVRLPRITGSLRAGGTLRVRGDISGGRLHARHVVLGRQRIDCLAITASESITIGAAHVNCDAIIAPVIQLDPKAFGRVTVIESRNDRGATKIKGGFSLVDYDDMFGNADEFLGTRGLSRLGPPGDGVRSPPSRTEPIDVREPTRPLPQRAPRPDPNPTESRPSSVLPMDEIDEMDEDTRIVSPPQSATPWTASRAPARTPSGSADRTGYGTPNAPATYPHSPRGLPSGHPPSAPPPPRRRVDEEEDDPSLSVSFGTMEPSLPDPSSPELDAHVQQQLAEALGRIVACYDGSEVPPAVQQLQSLVEQRDYEALRDDIAEVWNGLLGFHQQRGIRPHHQVTHAFNVIHGLVQA